MGYSLDEGSLESCGCSSQHYIAAFLAGCKGTEPPFAAISAARKETDLSSTSLGRRYQLHPTLTQLPDICSSAGKRAKIPPAPFSLSRLGSPFPTQSRGRVYEIRESQAPEAQSTSATWCCGPFAPASLGRAGSHTRLAELERGQSLESIQDSEPIPPWESQRNVLHWPARIEREVGSGSRSPSARVNADPSSRELPPRWIPTS